ncbi:MAG: Diaminopimelate decarboxylase [Alphaproteobacteria bacterium ADurb.Bin438]|nr:MAG: Diaminopimelate decarboxylase [Alphaproteobacteria bacterium ADurb.Bin438]
MKPYFLYKNNQLQVENVSINKIEQKTPFYCYSLSALKDNFKKYDDHAKTLGLDYTICYALKSNFNPHIVNVFAKLGGGADIVTGGELFLAKTAGIDASKIVFSGVGKSEQEIEDAISSEVMQINIESESEADLIIKKSTEMNKKANVAIRINPDVDAMTHQKISTGKKENKFGVSLKEALRVYKKLHESGAVNVVGIALHIGSQLLNCEPFEKAFRRTANFIQTLSDSGIEIKNIDVGGGIGIKYANFEDENTGEANLIAEYMAIVKSVFGDMGKKIIFEPGRSLTGNTAVLVTKVIHLKGTLEKKFIVVDAGMNDLMRPAMYNAWHEVLPVTKKEGGKEFSFDVVGPICESSDVFATQRKIESPEQGDLLAILSAGAYGTSMSSNYNFRPTLAEVIIDGDKVTLIKKAQTYKDMLSLYPEF